MLRSIRILSAAGVVGPLAASAMIYKTVLVLLFLTLFPEVIEYLGLDLVGILLVDDLFNSSRDEDVAVLEQQVFTSVGLSTREADNRAMLNLVVF